MHNEWVAALINEYYKAVVSERKQWVNGSLRRLQKLRVNSESLHESVISTLLGDHQERCCETLAATIRFLHILSLCIRVRREWVGPCLFVVNILYHQGRLELQTKPICLPSVTRVRESHNARHDTCMSTVSNVLRKPRKAMRSIDCQRLVRESFSPRIL